MTGARQFARDFIAPFVNDPHARVLDVACGDQWLKSLVYDRDHNYLGLDIKLGHDLRQDDWWNSDFVRSFGPDFITTVYGIITLLGEEARVWTVLRRLAKPTTNFIHVGSYEKPARRWLDRGDPINRHDENSIKGLAFASGWRVDRFLLARYDGEEYYCISENHVDPNLPPNAFAALMSPILPGQVR